ncbi:MAG TPA: carboxypeptidase regulatory-like domain-containing protein [Pyrinomonadaceae bacterium]|nr:carboxypeptidase regulatory-like domain-containing protein [Pyrinomonadaceae bacterium]
MKNLKAILFITLITLFINSNIFAQQMGSLGGQVVDTLGAAVVGATVIVVDANGKERSVTTNQNGEFTMTGLVPGKYIVRVAAENFGLYENTEVTITAGAREELIPVLTVSGVEEQVEVSVANQVNTDPDSNLSATVLKNEDLEALPDDPEELEAALQALAGASAGPTGGQIYIDGFTGGRIPPREAIREIRINQNPFSAEYDRLGFGRIEILTRPGMDKWRGSAFFNFNDDIFNARNPFADNRADRQTKFYGGNVSGPIVKGKSSFFLDVSNRQIDEGAIINALVLDPNFNIVPFREEFTRPTRRFSISPRFDYQINTNNTLVARYSFTQSTRENVGIGDFSLPTRAYETTNTGHDIQLTETMIINPKTINETRFRYENDSSEQVGDNTIPTISVSEAFVGGGAQVGFGFNRQNNWELQNYTTTSLGANNSHAVKFGARVRGITLKNRSESGYGGTFTFTGFASQNDPFDINGDGFVSSIEQYRARVMGATEARYNPNQFSITSGNPEASISQYDVGAFITDDWRFSPKLTLSFGLRYENQTNINDNFNFAPRFGFAYSPGAGGARPPKTVFRGGFGIFYNRFGESLVLNAERLDGFSQQRYIVTNNPGILGQPIFTLDGVANVPTAAQLGTVLPLSSIPQRIDPNLQAPYTIQGAFGVERQLPYNVNLSLFYVASRNLHLLRNRNINAPVCPTPLTCPTNQQQVQLLRPDPTQGNIYQYESSGVFNQQQLIVNFRTFYSPNLSLFGNYRLGWAKSDTDSFGGFGGFGGGAGGFPSYSYDLSGEYGTSAFDIRHNLFLGGNIRLPWAWGISLNPFIIARSGSPFNIVTGRDTNLDSVFTERPTFAQLNAACVQRGLNNDFCDIGNVADPNAIIPRNFGRGPGFFSVNLNISKNFGFGSAPQTASTQGTGQQRPQGGGIPGAGRGGRGGGGGGGRGGMGGMGGGETRSPYNLNVGIRISNLFNTVNEGNPIGNLNSPFFGRPASTAGGFGFGGGGSAERRIELQTRFSW